MIGKILKYLVIFLLLFGQKSSALSPSIEYLQYPFDLFSCVKVDSLTIKSKENIDIHTWTFHPKVEEKSILIFMLHAGEGNMVDYMHRAGTMAQHGYTVVLFDYRGFGYSSAYYIEEDQLYLDEFLLDYKAIYEHFTTKIPHKKKGMVGLGIGTIISQLFLSENSSAVDFAIYEGFALNPVTYAFAMNPQQSRSMTLPSSAYSFEKTTKNVKTPTLIFYGRKDELTKEYDVQKYIKGRKKSRFIEYFDGGHLQGMMTLTKENFGDIYMEKMTQFIRSKSK